MLAEADVTLISLADYAMPLYDANLEAASGPPENAFRLKRLMCAQDGVFIASPEYNACCGALVIPEQVAVREAASAFDEMDQLKDERTVRLLKSVVNRLVDMARGFA
jgi:NAD(P)H-dependent FMN reductase